MAEPDGPPDLPSLLRERLELWLGGRSPARLAASALAVMGIAVALIVLLRPAGASPPPPELHLPMASASAPGSGNAGAATSSSPPALIVVHAAGAVARPGLYRLPSSSRVADAIDAAGGLAPDADADRVNLAAPLSDGQRVFVPKVGQPLPDDTAANANASGPLDLNTATEADLDGLPGIGPTTAKAIVAERTRRGGRFSSVDDLLEVRGIGPAKLDELRPLVTVG